MKPKTPRRKTNKQVKRANEVYWKAAGKPKPPTLKDPKRR